VSPHRTRFLALGLLAMACAPRAHAARRDDLPPPAPVSRAGTREPGAGPASGSPETTYRAPVQARRAPGREDRIPREQRVHRAIETAVALVGQKEIVVRGQTFGDGCVALIRAAYAEAGVPLPEAARDAEALHALAKRNRMTRRGRPAPGDLVFLADRPGGPVEHVGLVESVSPEGTALVLHRTETGVRRLHLNGGQAWKTRADGGRTLNDVLVVGGGRLPAGRLLVAFATVL
jgi:hypothetical protein